MIIILNESVSSDMMKTIAEAYNTSTGVVQIYMSSDGGGSGEYFALKHLIDQNKDRTILYFYCGVSSALFNLMITADCEKYVIDACSGLFHRAWGDISLNDTGKPDNPYAKASLDRLTECREHTEHIAKNIGLTAKEKRELNKGQDLYFNADRMRGMINLYNRKVHGHE